MLDTIHGMIQKVLPAAIQNPTPLLLVIVSFKAISSFIAWDNSRKALVLDFGHSVHRIDQTVSRALFVVGVLTVLGVSLYYGISYNFSPIDVIYAASGALLFTAIALLPMLRLHPAWADVSVYWLSAAICAGIAFDLYMIGNIQGSGWRYFLVGGSVLIIIAAIALYFKKYYQMAKQRWDKIYAARMYAGFIWVAIALMTAALAIAQFVANALLPSN